MPSVRKLLHLSNGVGLAVDDRIERVPAAFGPHGGRLFCRVRVGCDIAWAGYDHGGGGMVLARTTADGQPPTHGNAHDQARNAPMSTTNGHSGFTLIELITVIVILGVLAMIAMPRYIELQDEAEYAAAAGVAGALSAAFATNYAGSLVLTTTPAALGELAGADQFVAIDNLAAIETPSDVDESLMTGDPLDGNYTIDCDSAGGTSFNGAGDAVECNLEDADGNAFSPEVIFTAIATS